MATNITTVNLLTQNPTYLNSVKNDKFYSSRLVNYVEPIEIGGYRKTVFYSEVNTNFNVGDRVFIVNGNYDSDNLIAGDKYQKFTDGYRVLGCDGCRIILDIDYTGVLPSEGPEISDYINIQHVQSQREFDYVNELKVGLDLVPQDLYSKYFGQVVGGTATVWTNNIIYAATAFNGTSGLWNGLTSSGFFVRDDSVTPNAWKNISSFVENNSWTFSNIDYPNNGRIYILGEDFTYNGFTYKQRVPYKFESGIWKEDLKYKSAYISKLNFRFGTFNGTHNDGIFGTGIKANAWKNATWNSGIFVNSIWSSGKMNIKSSLGSKSTYAKIVLTATGSSVAQSIDFSNNKGYGYNYIIDSTITEGTIQYGNFENCNLGEASSFSAIDSYYGPTQSPKITIDGAIMTLCDINSANITGSIVINSEVKNTNLEDTKLISSQVIDSTALKSEYNATGGIRVVASDIWSYDTSTASVASPSLTSIRGVIKLFISTEDLYKFNLRNTFYISKLNKDYILSSFDPSGIDPSDQKVLLPVETKYLLDQFFNQELSAKKIIVSLKTVKDNKWKHQAADTGVYIYNKLSESNIKYASIDIDSDIFGYYLDLDESLIYMNNYSINPITHDNINTLFLNTYLHNSDFKSGIFENSVWKTGTNMNYYQNIIKKLPTDKAKLDISASQISATYSALNVKVNYNPLSYKYTTEGEDLFVNDYVWIESLDYINGTYSLSLNGRYKVSLVNYFTASTPAFVQYTLLPQENLSAINQLTQLETITTGYYTTISAENNTYLSIHKFLIKDSTINSALFKRTGLVGNRFINTKFDNLDKNLTPQNFEIMRIVNSVFKNTSNIINNGLIYKSHFVNDTWNSGIAYNSIWNLGTFNNGTFKAGYWQYGQFNNGMFLDSDVVETVTTSLPMFSFYKVRKDAATSVTVSPGAFIFWIGDWVTLSGVGYTGSWQVISVDSGPSFTSVTGVFTDSSLTTPLVRTLPTVSSLDIPTRTLDFDNQPRLKVWLDGTFSGGEFYNGLWLKGTFNNGRFYKSNFLGGVWNNGYLGSEQYNTIDTKMGYYAPFTSSVASNIIWNNGIVENAQVGGYASLSWYNGKFNNGEFTSYDLVNSIWYNGDFNGGSFTNMAKWKNGNFNQGKFLSYLGWQKVSPTNSSTYSIDYGWENGRFNGGVFGNASGMTNSIWYDGEFNDGLFQGRFWNYGILSNGRFVGSGVTTSTINNFVQSFTNSYFGIWNDGYVIDRKSLLQTSQITSTTQVRKIEYENKINTAFLSNVLWLNGTFSHTDGEMNNSVWLNGSFIKGDFNSSFFNPYVDRQFSGVTPSFNFTDTCVWYGGNFNGGNFYISEWKNGNFLSGEMTGGVWRNGTWFYGNANNIYWENGTWKNGIWNGSPFVASTYSVTQSGTGSLFSNYVLNQGFEHDILVRIAQISGTNSIHLINAVTGTFSSEYLSDPNLDGSPKSIFSLSSTYDVSILNTDFSGAFTSNWVDSTNFNDWSIIEYDYNTTPSLSPSISISYPDGGMVIVNNGGYVRSEFIWLIVKNSLFGAGSGMTQSVLQKLTGTIYPDESINYDVTLDFILEANAPYPGFSSPDNTATFTVTWGDFTPARTITTTLSISSFIEPLIVVNNNASTTSRVYYYPAKKTTVNFSVSEKDIISGNWSRQIKIQRVYGLGILHLVKSSVKMRTTIYSPFNNTLYPSLPASPTFSSTISVPDSLVLSLISSNYLVPLTFGNGLFKTGIWENGVWNNGWRKDDYVHPFILTNSYQIDDTTWTLTLHQIGTEFMPFVVGDKVSIGNIVAMDINGKRKLIKDYFTIINISNDDSITCQVVINFPIVSIISDTFNLSPYVSSVLDSSSQTSTHINYVTKNIWLSGAFLNGYFTGVWNNGIVKGRPYLTFLEDVQWIEGIFDGGHIKGLTGSVDYTRVTSYDNVRNFVETYYNIDDDYNINYNKSLIQNFTFYDNNVASPYQFLFDSWLDINYNSESHTFLGKDSGSFVGQFNYTYTLSDQDGDITYDVLSSESYFRNGFDSNTNRYNLGMKYNKTELLNSSGNFDDFFSKQYSALGLDNFFDKGWTARSYQKWVFNDSFLIENTEGTLKVISATADNGQYSTTGLPFPISSQQNYIILDNLNSKLDKRRYSMMEYTLLSFTGFAGFTANGRDVWGSTNFWNPALHSGVLPATYSLASKKVRNPLLYSPSLVRTTYLDTVQPTPNTGYLDNISSPIYWREYYYNKPNLGLFMMAGSSGWIARQPFEWQFDNINFYEVDMIPFFNYLGTYGTLVINQAIQAPYYVTYVPPIDYNNANFNLINNIEIRVTAATVSSPTNLLPNQSNSSAFANADASLTQVQSGQFSFI